MKTRYNNMSCDFTVYQAFSCKKNVPLKEKKEYLEEQIAWTEEQIDILQQKLEQLQCLLEYACPVTIGDNNKAFEKQY